MDILLWGSIFAAGLLSFFSPCVLPLFPVYFGVLMSERGTRSIKIGKFEVAVLPVVRTFLFVAGISTIFFVLGFAASLLGQLLYNPYFHLVLGTIIVLLGLHQMEVFQLTSLQKQKTVQFETKNEKSLWSSYLLGLSFSFGWTPCVGPVLSSVLTLVATQQASVFYGMFLLGIYILGLSIPFLVLSIASTTAMKTFNLAKKQLFLLKKIGGIVIIAMGVWIIIQQLQVLFLQG
jgi:cytochrome c-type biogenesis protein ccdA